MTKIKQISLGFPQNITINNTIDLLDTVKQQDYTNKNVHLKLTMDKLQKKNFSADAIAREVKEATHAETVKVSFIYETDTNIRAKEITEQTDIKEKFKTYAEINNIKYSDSVLDKITNIQDTMMLQSFTPHETFTLEYMSLRGAIGIMDGQGKEEVSFDFANGFEEGIIAITGPSGAGKSTILENMHPYPCMLSRTGTLKEHFCLKDSHRIVVYRTETEKKYRISMFISGTAKNQDTKYYVEVKQPGKDWEELKSVDGSNKSYLDWVESTFGPKELFLRTAFYTNASIKGMPDLSQATKSEKMELFSTLAGTDYLSIFSEQAKLLAKTEEKSIEEIKGQLKGYDDIDQRLEDANNLISENNKKIDEANTFIEKDTAELSEYEEKQKLFIQAESTYDLFRSQLSEKHAEHDKIQRALTISNNNIEAIQQQLDEMDLYKEQLTWYEENMTKRKTLVSEEKQERENFYNLQAELDKKQEEYDKHKSHIVELKSQYDIALATINNLTSSIPDLNGVCPVCGRPLEEHKQEELKKEVERINADIDSQNKHILEIQSESDKENKWIKDNSLQNFKSELSDINNKIMQISNDISDIDTYAERLNIDEIKDVVNNAQDSFDKESANNRELKDNLNDLDALIEELNIKLNTIPEDFTDKINRLKRGIDNSRQEISTLSAEITMANKEIERLKNFAENVKNIKEQIKEHQKNIKDYEIIQNAFSNNGIQALELDSAAPEISAIANSILEDTYGDRFTISFDTQRDTKDGRKIDDFIINVFDSKSGRLKRLDLISSGEGALIKQTLYYAFSVIRARRTGFCFKTRFLDESDGALDSELRIKYLKMIEAAHKQCGAVQTILITHSQELKEIIEQKIEL